MKCLSFKSGFALVGSLAASLLLSPGAHAQVTVDVYRQHLSNAGGGAPYAGFVNSFMSPDVAFIRPTGFSWHPYGLPSFGADLHGCITVPTTGLYTFGLNSDDGSLFFLNGLLNVNNGGPHPPGFVSGTTAVNLIGGVANPFEIQFYEDFGGPSGLDLLFASGDQSGIGIPGAETSVPESFSDVPASDFTCVPEPGTLPLLATGGLPLLGLLRRRLSA